jgi:hypothetical protein
MFASLWCWLFHRGWRERCDSECVAPGVLVEHWGCFRCCRSWTVTVDLGKEP